MRYVIAIILPPLAVLLCGKPMQAILNLVLCFFFYVPGIIHALIVVASHKADVRAKMVVRAMCR